MNAQGVGNTSAKSWLIWAFARPPFIGLFPFAVFFISQGLGHSVMIQMEESMGEPGMYYFAGAMGLLGAVLLWYGMRQNSEVSGTWLGYFAAWLLWTGWVEFSFVYYARWLGVAPLLDEAGEVATNPEYLVMMSSLGVMLATLVYFLFNRETRCNFFRWCQRWLGMGTGRPTEGHKRNFAAITALETIYLIWFFYLFLLLIYDENLLGERHPVTYGIAALNAVWAIYLFAAPAALPARGHGLAVFDSHRDHQLERVRVRGAMGLGGRLLCQPGKVRLAGRCRSRGVARGRGVLPGHAGGQEGARTHDCDAAGTQLELGVFSLQLFPVASGRQP